jgi:two-component system, LuxR family, sensor kinase FixL
MDDAQNSVGTDHGQPSLQTEFGVHRRDDDLFKQILEACPSGMLLIDKQGVITFANACALRYFGYKAKELTGQLVETLVPTTLRDRHPELRGEYLQHPVPRAMGEARDLNGVRKDGTEIPVEIGLSPLGLSDGLHVLVNIVDISQRKRLEAELRAKNEEMEQLIYIVSHDLRSPLVTIEGFAGMIGEHLQSNQLEQVGDDLARVRRASATMARLIHDVLELSRAGRQPVKVDEVNVREVLDEVATSMEATLKQARARLIIAGVPHTVRADRCQLVQVFMNLIGNAVKHGCPEPGGLITIGGERRRAEDALFVRDNGPGVEPKLRERIFKPFQSGDHHRDGAGLGLAIVSKIAERHQGRTWVESTLGSGTTFWITLPVNLANSSSEPAIAS